jgi:hypothetical protein
VIFTCAVRPQSRRPADNRSVMVRLLVRALAGCALAFPLLVAAAPASTFAVGPACGEHLYTNPQGLQVNVLFAKNGAVQRYVIVTSHDNTEAVNDMLKDLEKTFGPEGVNAPPLHITSFKPGGSGGMMVPDKAVDSCGRTQSFQ